MHDRLPKGFPRIIAMTAEDHYVKVIGDGRSEMVLMSLSEPSGWFRLPQGCASIALVGGAIGHRGSERSGRDHQGRAGNRPQGACARGRAGHLKDAGLI